MTNPLEDPQSEAALKKQAQEYLIEQSLKGALRHLYGDAAVNTTRRIAKDLARELVTRGVFIVPLFLGHIRSGVVRALLAAFAPEAAA
jgi:hypothetical protein